jgi:ABC-2 type transport system permease protein
VSDPVVLDASEVPSARWEVFAGTLRSEWAKLRTLRSSAYTLLTTVIVGVGFAVLYTGGAGGNYTELSPEQQAEFDPTFTSLLGGVLLSQLALGVLGVLVVTSEYATGTIIPSLTVTPRRGRLLAAKVTVFTAVALVVGEVVGFGSFLAGQAVLAAIGDVPHAALGQPGVLRAVAAAGPYLALVGLLGLAVGVMVRSAAGAITILVAATLLIPNLGQLLGDVFRYWPPVAGLWSLTAHAGFGHLAALAGLGLQAAAVAVTLATAFVVFRHRDA